ncbi:MAG: NfeD family protein [Thermodesulfobacteriota bacterium]
MDGKKMAYRTVSFRILAWLSAAAVLLLLPASFQARENNDAPIYVIEVSGTVDPGMSAYIKRAQREITQAPYRLVVVDVDTYGGRVDSAMEIVDTLIRFPEGKTVSFVREKAISAGALIALASSELVMAPGSTIGDTAPIAMGTEGPEMLGEKYQSPIRAKFRSLAERNNYPVALTEAMVTLEIVVYEITMEDGTVAYMTEAAYQDLAEDERGKIASRKTVVPEGQLLTMHDREAETYGFSRMSVPDIPAMLARMGYDDYTLVRVTPSWSEEMVRLIGSIAPVLLMIGLAALYVEMQAPGFGFPGTIGVILLAIVFFGQYAVGLADYTEFLIILLGLVLMGVEVFVLPGFGIAGLAGAALITVGFVLALQDFVVPDPDIPWQMDILVNNIIRVLGSFILAFLGGLLVVRFLLPRISSKNEGPFLVSDLGGAHADSEETKRIKTGDAGIALTFLRPSGKAEINGEIFDVISDNEYIEKSTPVFVSQIRGNWIVVQRKDAP